MKRSTKIISLILVFFLIITIVIVGRMMIGNHFKKKFSKVPPPGIIVTKVVKKEFSEKIALRYTPKLKFRFDYLRKQSFEIDKIIDGL